MKHDLQNYLAVAVESCHRGAAELEAWRSKFTVREKSRADLVTDADTASQQAVKSHLFAAFPGHHFLGEEDSFGKSIESLRPAANAPPTWVCDPLDGTGNYAHGVPAYCVNLALLIDAKPVVAVTLDPRLNELYTATRGGGAFLNGEPICVSPIASLGSALLSTGFPSDYEKQLRNLAAWQRVSKEAQALRRTGSSALNMAYLAAGRFDGYWCYDNWPWDVVPGMLLVEEAGGKVTNASGGPFDPFKMDILATNGPIHADVLKALLI
ncbi:inositol monophosphatase family protein [soil metagenome]